MISRLEALVRIGVVMVNLARQLQPWPFALL
jgi:hypothetical protein